MKPYLVALAAGLLVGIIYNLLGVKSPAPPTIALIGLLGMLVGEQVIPVAKRLASGRPVLAFIRSECAPHILGPQAAPKAATPPTTEEA
jgi:XapX domain-containing protein